MATGPLSIKLRCASWQQLATIYKRDLSRGTMFLKAATPPPVGTIVRIDLSLPSASVIVLQGVVERHVTDATRGTGVELKLAPIPAGSVWMIESALASEHKRRQTPAAGVPVTALTAGSQSALSPSLSQAIPSISEAEDVVAAEHDLVKALLSEVESLKKLNPFLVLGVGYEASDPDVRAAFGELTKRYHPDLFARYESTDLRTVAAEIFILIRDAYRKLGDETGRVQVLASLGRASAPRAVPMRHPTPPPIPVKPPRAPTGAIPISPPPPPPQARPFTDVQDTVRPGEPPHHDRARPPVTTRLPTGPTPVISTKRDRGDATPVTPQPPRGLTPPLRTPRRESQLLPQVPRRAESSQSQALPVVRHASTDSGSSETTPLPPHHTDRRPVGPVPAVVTDGSDSSALEEMLDAGQLDQALAAYKVMTKRTPADRTFRAGIELCEGLKSLALRDRLEAAQRFEAALEIDPSNERAARELAEMRRLATNERRGLLTRLMGKKES